MESATLGAAPAQGLRPARERSDQRTVAWTALAAGALIAVGGTLGDSQLLVALGGAIIAALGAFLIPQLLLAAFLVAGGLKAAPWLAALPVDLTLLTAAGVLAAIVVRASKPDGIRPMPYATLLALALAALVGLSVIWSPAPDLGLDKALRFQTFTMIAFFAPFVLVRSRGDLTRLMLFVVAASLVVALTAVPGTDPNQPLTVAGGNSEIELALYASSGIVAAIYLLLALTSPWRILLVVPAVMLAETVIAAGSRGVLIGTIFAGLVIAAMAVWRSRSKVVPIALIACAVIAAISFGAEVAGPAASAKYQGLFGGGAGPETLGKRNFLVQDGIQMFLAHPMGNGASGYQAEIGFPYPHNAFVEVAAEQGVIGLALLTGLIVAAFVATRRAREGPLSPEAILTAGLLIVLVSDAMVSQTYTQFRELWFAMGLALAVPFIGAREPDADAPGY
ncbi:MAG TPA: O-antigen ligase family protein [Thermoleophilaceae bacterium]